MGARVDVVRISFGFAVNSSVISNTVSPKCRLVLNPQSALVGLISPIMFVYIIYNHAR